MAINFWDEELQVNTTTGGTKSFANRAVSLLPNGRIAAIWYGSHETGDGDPTEFGHGIRGRILNPDGAPAGAEFVVNSTTLNAQDQASVTTLTDGRFVVTWHSNENGDGGSGGNLTIRARVFNADGTPAMYDGDGSGPNAASTNDFVVNNVAGFNDISPVVTALAGGGFAIAWQAPSAPFGAHNIALRVFTSAGPAGGQQSANVDNHNHAPAITTLNDGRFVVAWHQEFPDPGAPDGLGGGVRARIFLATGAVDMSVNEGKPLTIDTTNINSQFAINITTLKDGRFIAAWINNDPNDDGSSTAIRARVFKSDGTPDPDVNGGNDFRVNTTTLHDQRRPNIVALDDGGFFISFWSRSDFAGNLKEMILGRFFNADGTPQTPDIVVNEGAPTAGGGTSGAPHSLVRMPDGRIYVMYDNENAAPSVINGRFFSFDDVGKTLNGDGAANEFIGTAAADTLKGEGGNDFLMGGGGVDLLEGGDGADRLHGGGFNDNLKGGAGQDILDGGLGVDTADYSNLSQAVQVFLGGAGDGFAFVNNIFEDTIRAIEHVFGGAGNDALVGDGGINALYGGGGRDFLFSNGFAPDGTMTPNANDDTLFGEDGDDGLFGGDGKDTLHGGAGADGLVGGANDDLLNGGAGGDFLFAGGFNLDGSLAPNPGNDTMNGDEGDDAIFGFGGNDVINGGADNDYLDGGGGDDMVSGGAGNDFVLGGAGGTDTVTGGAGFDYLYGGNGSDTFIFRKGDSADWILDWSGDKLRLEGFGYANFGEVPLVDLSTPGSPAVQLTVFNATTSAYDQLTIFGVTLAELNAGNVLVA